MKRLLLNLFLLPAIILFHTTCFSQSQNKIKYVFLFIGDGMGHRQVFLTEKYNELNHLEPLIFLNNKWSFGLSMTECADSNKITDSGAGGTAIACGERTSYGKIGEYKGIELESIAEHLIRKMSFKIGIITTVPINHATPASFYGHEPTRRNYDNLTNDLIASGFDFFAGGGFELGNADSSMDIYRSFDMLILKLKENNFQTELNENQYNSLTLLKNNHVIIVDTAIRNKQLILKNVYSDEKNSLPFTLDFPKYKMQLAKYTEAAQNSLLNESGFFIMVEGGKIDWACHDNDALTAIYEINAFNEAIKKAYEFYQNHPENTLIIVTADHETGGMTLGSGNDENSSSKINKYALYVNKLNQQKGSYILTNTDQLKKIQDEAQIGWTTNEHTSAPVGIWAIGRGSNSFSGIMKNSEIKEKILKLVK